MSILENITITNGIGAGTAGAANVQVVTVQGITGMTPVVVSPNTALYVNAIAPASPASSTVKGGAGTILGIKAFNLLATPVFLKIFDVTAAVTMGTTAATFQFMIPGNTGGAGFVIEFVSARACANAIKYAVTGGISFTDNTSITGNSVLVDITYN